MTLTEARCRHMVLCAQLLHQHGEAQERMMRQYLAARAETFCAEQDLRSKRISAQQAELRGHAERERFVMSSSSSGKADSLSIGCKNERSNGPSNTRCNCSKSGWFGLTTFTDWFTSSFISETRRLGGRI